MKKVGGILASLLLSASSFGQHSEEYSVGDPMPDYKAESIPINVSPSSLDYPNCESTEEVTIFKAIDKEKYEAGEYDGQQLIKAKYVVHFPFWEVTNSSRPYLVVDVPNGVYLVDNVRADGKRGMDGIIDKVEEFDEETIDVVKVVANNHPFRECDI